MDHAHGVHVGHALGDLPPDAQPLPVRQRAAAAAAPAGAPPVVPVIASERRATGKEKT